jgi:hypothetical protein
MRTGRWIDMMKLVVAFRNFGKAPKNYLIHAHYKLYCTAYDGALTSVQGYTQPLELIMRDKTQYHIYGYVNLLYYKQRSLLHVSATYCGHLQGMFFEG